MNYQQFRTAWYEALTEAGICSFLSPPTETVDLGGMDRTYQVYVHLGPSHEVAPFHVTARLSWTWDALLAARMATTEEDALMLFLGDERRHQDTERPWLRVDVTLHATLPWGSPLPLPEAGRWRQWVAAVTERLEPLLPTELGPGEQARLVLAWPVKRSPAMEWRVYFLSAEAWSRPARPRRAISKAMARTWSSSMRSKRLRASRQYMTEAGYFSLRSSGLGMLSSWSCRSPSSG